jgi:5-formyltetrahydrofolate cyclo-ligase
MKDIFRKHCIKKLSCWYKLSICQQAQRSKYINKKLKKLIEKTKAKNILFYMPFGFEIDVLPLIKSLRKEHNKKYKIFIPHIVDETFIASIYRLPIKKETKLNMKQSNISNFLNQRIKLDLCIVPILGFDNTYKRVGFGLGMYDRFFGLYSKLRIKRKLKIVFVQNKICFNKITITNNFDIKANYIISPINNTKKQKSNLKTKKEIEWI